MPQTLNGNKAGFSIIEMLIAIAILAMALTALLGMASFSLGIQGLVRQTTQADNLAQEAMEAVRSIRDNKLRLRMPIALKIPATSMRITAGIFLPVRKV